MPGEDPVAITTIYGMVWKPGPPGTAQLYISDGSLFVTMNAVQIHLHHWAISCFTSESRCGEVLITRDADLYYYRIWSGGGWIQLSQCEMKSLLWDGLTVACYGYQHICGDDRVERSGGGGLCVKSSCNLLTRYSIHIVQPGLLEVGQRLYPDYFTNSQATFYYHGTDTFIAAKPHHAPDTVYFVISRSFITTHHYTNKHVYDLIISRLINEV